MTNLISEEQYKKELSNMPDKEIVENVIELERRRKEINKIKIEESGQWLHIRNTIIQFIIFATVSKLALEALSTELIIKTIGEIYAYIAIGIGAMAVFFTKIFLENDMQELEDEYQSISVTIESLKEEDRRRTEERRD
jgi:hypothetical protein